MPFSGETLQCRGKVWSQAVAEGLHDLAGETLALRCACEAGPLLLPGEGGAEEHRVVDLFLQQKKTFQG